MSSSCDCRPRPDAARMPTINRALASLRRMFILGIGSGNREGWRTSAIVVVAHGARIRPESKKGVGDRARRATLDFDLGPPPRQRFNLAPPSAPARQSHL